MKPNSRRSILPHGRQLFVNLQAGIGTQRGVQVQRLLAWTFREQHVRVRAMSDRERQPDLGLIARQQQQILTEVGSLRDDMTVLTSIALRQDSTLTALLGEVRAMHSQHGRLANRVRQLETDSTKRD